MLEIKVNKPYPLSKMRKPSIWDSGARCQGSNTVGQLEQVTSPISTSFPFKKKKNVNSTHLLELQGSKD